MPFKRFEDMGFIRHSKHLGIIQLDKAIHKRLGKKDYEHIKLSCEAAIQQYFG